MPFKMGFRIGALKLLIFVPNLLLFVLGCVMVGFSADWLRNKDGKYEWEINGSLQEKVRIGSGLLMAAGIFAGITSFLAICGVLANKRKLLIAYSVIIGLILLFEVGAAIAGFMGYNYVRGHLQASLNTYKANETDPLLGWNNNDLFRIQYYFGCCGIQSNLDWKHANNYNYKERECFPSSCCHIKEENHNCTSDATDLHEKGCYKKIKEFLPSIGVASIVIFCIQLVMLMVASFLSTRINEDQTLEIF